MFILILLIGFTKWTICRMCLASCLIDSPNVTSQDKPKHECVIGLETAGRYQIQSKACFILLFKTLPCPPESTLKFWQVVKKKSRKICLGYVSYLSFIHELMQLSIQWVKISLRHGFRCLVLWTWLWMEFAKRTAFSDNSLHNICKINAGFGWAVSLSVVCIPRKLRCHWYFYHSNAI